MAQQSVFYLIDAFVPAGNISYETCDEEDLTVVPIWWATGTNPPISNHRVSTLLHHLVWLVVGGEFMNKPILLLIAFSAVACFAQEPLNYGLTGVRRLQFEAALEARKLRTRQVSLGKVRQCKGIHDSQRMPKTLGLVNSL